MMWLMVVLGIAIVGGGAAVAAGRGELLHDAEDRSPAARLPAGAVSAEALRSIKFTPSLYGYRMAEVDELIARLAHDLERGPSALRLGAVDVPANSNAGPDDRPEHQENS